VTLAAARATEERLGPAERLALLCDPGSFRPLRSGVTAQAPGVKPRAGDGVLAGAGRVGGRPIFCYAEDPSFMGGSLGEAHANSIVRVLELARRSGRPAIGLVESAGARLQEGHAALGGYGRIFKAIVDLSRVAPQITIVTGVSAGGGAYAPALTDFVVMTEAARMFLTGPRVVREALGEAVTMEELGGPHLHGRNGVCELVVGSDAEAAQQARALLAHLPDRVGERPPEGPPLDPAGGDPAAPVPDDPRRVYDVRDVAERIIDGGELLELGPRWARNMVTGLGRIDGRAVGVIANQPHHLGGVIDAAAAEKGALFIDRCERFRLPLVVLVDTPGFMPGQRQEAAGVIRHGASLLRAFAAATVPRVTVVVRKAYGGAVITMNSKDLGSDLVLAWPSAEIGIMAANQAVGIVHRRRLEADGGDPGLRAELAAAYTEEHLGAEAAAADGFVDEVIDPAETRARLAWALGSLERDR
jgi:acetyl-CoA carboxylase carboxyltransferase component